MDEDASIGAGLLFDSVRLGKLRMIRFILDSVDGNLVNARDIKGRTPLIMCVFIREELTRGRAFTMMLENGADHNATDDDGRDVLSVACENKCNDLVRILVKCNINPEVADLKGNTPLIYCAMVGNDVAIDLLVRHFRRLGLHIDHANKEGFTALLMAAKHGNSNCAEILVLQGKASLLHRDRVEGRSAEDWLGTHGMSLKDSLKSACRAAKLERVRRLLAVIRPDSTSKSTSGSKKLASTLEPVAKLGETNRRQSLPEKSRVPVIKIASELSHEKVQAMSRGYRSGSLGVPLTMSGHDSAEQLVLHRQRSLDVEPRSGSRQCSRLIAPSPDRRLSAQRPDFSVVLGEHSDSDGSDSSTEIQTLSLTSVEKLEEEIATLF